MWGYSRILEVAFFWLSHESEILNGWESVQIPNLEFKRIILIIQHIVSIFLHKFPWYLIPVTFLSRKKYECIFSGDSFYVCLSLYDACCSVRWKSNNNLCQGNNKTENEWYFREENKNKTWHWPATRWVRRREWASCRRRGPVRTRGGSGQLKQGGIKYIGWVLDKPKSKPEALSLFVVTISLLRWNFKTHRKTLVCPPLQRPHSFPRMTEVHCRNCLEPHILRTRHRMVITEVWASY